MTIMKTYLSVTVAYFFMFSSLTILSSSVQAQLVGFQPLSTAVPQDVNGIQLGIYCDGSLTGRYRTGIVTVEATPPGSTIQVLTYPPDLVTAVVEDTDSEHFSWFRYLRLEYNPSVAGALGGGLVGIQILYPSDKLEGIWMGAGSQGQLIGNFPPLTNIEVTGGSQFHASLSGEANDDLLIQATGEDTKVYLSHEGGSIPKLIARSFAYVELTAMKVLEVDISNSAKAYLEVLVPPGGTIESSGNSSTASLDINLQGGCKRVFATNAAKCTDGVDLDLRDVTAIVEDVSNMVVQGATATCIRDERQSSSSSSSAGGSNLQSDGNGNGDDDDDDDSDKNGKNNGGAIAGAIMGIILGLILLGILAWLGWRVHNQNKTDKSSKEVSKSKPTTKQDSQDRRRRDQKHHDDIEAPLSPSKKNHSTSTKTKKRWGNYEQDQSVPATSTQSPRRKLRPLPLSLPISPTMSLREDERDIPIPATPPYSKKRSIPPKKKVVEKSSKKKPLQLEDERIVTPYNYNKRSIPQKRVGEKNGKKKPQQKPPKVVNKKPGHNNTKQNNPRK